MALKFLQLRSNSSVNFAQNARTRKDWIYVFYIVPDPQKKRGLERLFDSIRHVIVNHQHIPLETRHRNVFRIYTLDELQQLDLDHGI